jgi:ribosomal-protein-alanine N-acetyltransferase
MHIQHPELTHLALLPMTQTDIPQIMAIEVMAYTQPWTEGIFNDCLRVGYSCWSLKQTDTNRLLGYLIVTIAADEMHILNICIDPKKQGRKLGSTLLKQAIKLGKAMHITSCFLEVRPSNKAAMYLYLNNGFEKVGLRKNYYPNQNGREDAIVMKKSIQI